MSVTKDSGNRFLLDLALTDNPTRPRWYCEAQHVSTLVSLVEAGMGIAAVPRLAMPPDGHPVLVSVPLVEPVWRFSPVRPPCVARWSARADAGQRGRTGSSPISRARCDNTLHTGRCLH